MAGLLNAGYADPRAQKLYGGGNAGISDADIKAFITQPGMTDDKIYKKALELGVSAKQITNAMYGTPGYDPRTIGSFIAKQGVSLAQAKQGVVSSAHAKAKLLAQAAPPSKAKPLAQEAAPPSEVVVPPVEAPKAKTEYTDAPKAAIYTPASAPAPVRPSSVKLTSADTVAGQLDSITRDPNSPLLRQAQTRALQSTNRRGLSNSSIAVSAGESALLDAAMPIASQDANTNFSSKSQNSQLAQNASLFNADTLAKMNMFNSDLDSKTSMFNADLGSRVGMFNADLGTKTNLFNADLGSKVGMFNADLGSRVGMFNSDQSSRVDMFNSGQSNDIMTQRERNDLDLLTQRERNDLDRWTQSERNDLDRYIANMDTDNKLAIANIQAMANDSGIMGDTNRTAMQLMQQTMSNMDLPEDIRKEIVNNIIKMTQDSNSALPSLVIAGKGLTFGAPAGDASAAGGTTESGKNSDAAATDGPGNVPAVAKKVNVLGYQPEPTTLSEVAAYERQTGNKVDRSKVVPQQLIEDMRYGNMTMAYGQSYLANDGTTKTRNFTAYDYQKLMKETGATNQGDLFNKLFAPVYQPRTMRGESVMFYLYR